MTKILLLARLMPQSGNLTTAERIKCYLQELGYTCELKDTTFFESVEHFTCYAIENEICCVLGIHLWRAGKLLLDCPVPFSIIFGGTDLNEHVKDSKKIHLMTQVVQNAKNLVAFSHTMALKAEQLWAGVKLKLIVQPQAVFTGPSQDFTEEAMIERIKDCVTINGGESSFLNPPWHNTLIIFLLVAGLRPVKDPMFLFQVISDWHIEDSRVFLIVVGPEIDIEFSKEIKESAKKYPGVLIMPALPQRDLHAAIKYCSVAVVNTSTSEGMSATILEAMDLNTVVLARRIPANECLIKHNENGLLFETPKEFLVLAKQVAYDKKYRHRLALGGQKYISNNHSLSLEKETYKSIIETLIL